MSYFWRVHGHVGGFTVVLEDACWWCWRLHGGGVVIEVSTTSHPQIDMIDLNSKLNASYIIDPKNVLGL